MNNQEILKHNKFVVILNEVKGFYWRNKNFKMGIFQKDLNFILNDTIIEYCKDIKKLEKDFKKEMESYVIPSCKNIKQFFSINELPIKSIKEYQDFLKEYYI